jgi:hypothetical protein
MNKPLQNIYNKNVNFTLNGAFRRTPYNHELDQLHPFMFKAKHYQGMQTDKNLITTQIAGFFTRHKILDIKYNCYNYVNNCKEMFQHVNSESLSIDGVLTLPIINNTTNFYFCPQPATELFTIKLPSFANNTYNILVDPLNCWDPFDFVIGNKIGQINSRYTNLTEQLKISQESRQHILIVVTVYNYLANFTIAKYS